MYCRGKKGLAGEIASVLKPEHDVPVVREPWRRPIVQRKGHIETVKLAGWLLQYNSVKLALGAMHGAVTLRRVNGHYERASSNTASSTDTKPQLWNSDIPIQFTVVVLRVGDIRVEEANTPHTDERRLQTNSEAL